MKKHFKYVGYLARHKWFVFVAGIKVKAPLWRLIIHDWSKVLPCEWFAYANYFYVSKSKENTEAFRRAWMHHLHVNKHHWQYWIYIDDSTRVEAMKMPDKYVREMVADWMGAGRAINGRWEGLSWYATEKDKQFIHSDTKMVVEDLLIFASRKLNGEK